MKSIPNRKVLLEAETISKPDETTYVKLLIAVASTVLKDGKGVPRSEQKQRLRIIKAAKSAEENILLEDADYDFAKQLVDVFPWGIVSEQIDEFCEAFSAPETVNIAALTKATKKSA